MLQEKKYLHVVYLYKMTLRHILTVEEMLANQGKTIDDV